MQLKSRFHLPPRLAWHSGAMKPRRRRSRAARTTGAPFLHRIESLPEKIDPTVYPFNIRAFSHGIDLTLRSKVTFFVGENGSGKSTLLEALAECCGFNPEGGNRDHHRATFADRSPLAQALRLSWLPKVTEGFFMRAESFYNFATYIEERIGPAGVRRQIAARAVARRILHFAVRQSLRAGHLHPGRAGGGAVAATAALVPQDHPRPRDAGPCAVPHRDALADHPELPGRRPLRPRRRCHPGDRLSRDEALPHHPRLSQLAGTGSSSISFASADEDQVPESD